MVMTDPISDMLTRMRNALRAKHDKVEMPSSVLRVEIAKILKEEGYIDDFGVVESQPTRSKIVMHLRYGPDGEKVLSGLERVSRPSRRVYVGKREIPVVLGGIGIAIVSTSRGIMTGEQARQRSLGGEILCRVW